MDMDFVTIREFDSTVCNFASEHSPGYLAHGVLAVGSDTVGHELSRRALETFVRGFRRGDWDYGNVSRVVSTLWNDIDDTEEMMAGRTDDDLMWCRPFQLYAHNLFYPIKEAEWTRLFDESKKQSDSVIVASRNAFAVNMWNQFSARRHVRLGGRSGFERLALQFCPNVMTQIRENGDKWF